MHLQLLVSQKLILKGCLLGATIFQDTKWNLLIELVVKRGINVYTLQIKLSIKQGKTCGLQTEITNCVLLKLNVKNAKNVLVGIVYRAHT